MPSEPEPVAAPSDRLVVATSGYADDLAAAMLGQDAYSYHYVRRAFLPLLRRWGQLAELTQAESRLDYAVWRARQAGQRPIQLSFQPLHRIYLSRHLPNVSFPFWEFPNIPDRDLGGNPRLNWRRIAERLDLILVASRSTQAAFSNAGISTPVRLVPVPVEQTYFGLPAWCREQRLELDALCYVLPRPRGGEPRQDLGWTANEPSRLSIAERGRQAYRFYLRAYLPASWRALVAGSARAAAGLGSALTSDLRAPAPTAAGVELSGVVYSTVLNPLDPRKNWPDLLSAFLLALGDRPDATLVVKLVVAPELRARALREVLRHYDRLGLSHRCRLVLLAGYLQDAQMVELARASTYYLNTSRAEGACLPMQHSLAAGRPVVSPSHTALRDYFDADVGFVVDSHPEPAWWPIDPERRISTEWHRLVWSSLQDQLRASYEVARDGAPTYRQLSAGARERLRYWASAERVWPLLASALDSVDRHRPSSCADR